VSQKAPISLFDPLSPSPLGAQASCRLLQVPAGGGQGDIPGSAPRRLLPLGRRRSWLGLLRHPLLECGGNSTPVPSRVRGARCNRRAGYGAPARRCFGLGTVPGRKRRRRGACETQHPSSRQNLLASPSAEVRCNRAALPAHFKTKQSGIHKELKPVHHFFIFCIYPDRVDYAHQ